MLRLLRHTWSKLIISYGTLRLPFKVSPFFLKEIKYPRTNGLKNLSQVSWDYRREKVLKCIKKETQVKIEQKFLWLTFIDGDVAVDVKKIEANGVE